VKEYVQMTADIPPVLSGTWPVRAHANRFFGAVKADGQNPRVAGLVCYNGDVVAISLVGYETSTSAVLSSLWLREAVPFLLPEGLEWKGPRALRRRPEPYKQFSTQLANTKEAHYIALPASSHIAEGILHPPDLPKPKEEDIPAEKTASSFRRSDQPSMELPPIDRTRFVLGNWDEETPHRRAFLGHMYGMRVLFLHGNEQHAEWPTIWAAEMWKRGLVRKLIEPLPYALGLKAWKLSGDLEAWGSLIGEGTQHGWLPWQTTEAPPAAEDAVVPALALAR
jgi:hypothetical protein